VRDEGHRRQSIRLPGYDYAQPGAYFVTLCTQDRACLFGEVLDGGMRLNPAGDVVAGTWQWLSRQYVYLENDAWVVMPNHLHGILVIHPNGRGGSRTAPTRTTDNETGPSSTVMANLPESHTAITGPPRRKPLGRLIGAFKTVSTKQVNAMRGTPGLPLWQRNYYEHVIRDDESLDRIRRYIVDNPSRWAVDRDNPLAAAPEPEAAWRD
jgi:putative transposase